ncbi:hypothetical protein [Saccharopolyspora sp. 6M]|uniref:DUF7144 family membrane protein n=1 Tax=Saccharopolyspora sp. 6M TaxID=2877237 RepID=UPI001CD3D9EB|nr:hypothetical protein [Saccharopolyspora sp. 6M]MCA1226630.1 hypothetical protein [Saccharopolyspora sp. 6M]
MATLVPHPRQRPTGWVGWVYFAAFMLVLTGAVQIVNGLFALARSGTTYLTPGGEWVRLDLYGVGLGFLLLGVVLAAVGMGLFGGRTWARVVAVVLAVLSVLANVVLFAASPLWSSVAIVVDVLVVYALVMHGREAWRS